MKKIKKLKMAKKFKSQFLKGGTTLSGDKTVLFQS